MSSEDKSPSADSCPGRILAIDYGQKRIGLALSDEMGLTAQPFQTLERTNRRNDIRRLREIARQTGVRRIVVGHPVHLNGAESEMSAEAARFAARLKKELALPVELADERLSSWEAKQVLTEAGKKKEPGGAVDHVAAAVILRDYLARAKPKK